MNELVEKLCNSSLARSSCEDMRILISFISYIKYEVNTMIAISYVILGCLAVLFFVLNKKPKVNPPARPNYSRASIIRDIHSGNPILDRLVEDEYKKAQLNPATLANAENLLKVLLEEEHLDLMKLQQTVVKLEMSAEEESAIKILRNAKQKAKPHEAYEIEMLLVEMLIYKGENLDKVLLDCKCLEDESIKDARRPLYKAIIHGMLKNTEEAKKYLDEYNVVRDPFKAVSNTILDFDPRPDMDFQTFEHHVMRLQKATEDSGKKGRKN